MDWNVWICVVSSIGKMMVGDIFWSNRIILVVSTVNNLVYCNWISAWFLCS